MLKLKNQFKIISIYLFVFIGLLFINMNQVIAMNNNNVGTSEHVYNSLEEYRNYQNLLVSQQTKAQEVINALEHQVSETEKKLLFDQLELIHQQIIITRILFDILILFFVYLFVIINIISNYFLFCQFRFFLLEKDHLERSFIVKTSFSFSDKI